VGRGEGGEGARPPTDKQGRGRVKKGSGREGSIMAMMVMIMIGMQPTQCVQDAGAGAGWGGQRATGNDRQQASKGEGRKKGSVTVSMDGGKVR
jgi:hypothetical protein